ncbi:MAG: bifunctional DNA-formamidopyrimidine glycosylase/DNA-(apurinic or apyrimidinic site) lyase [candidate division KSB1 bacterium]|nr:bifunctional DNA-formamidopyrimidine glycosylase/DNA-(apurinic or apyrimidinic site) lyase [candidate division KSB1 bacterium]
MPELPEIETIKATMQFLVADRITQFSVLNQNLRWTVPIRKLNQHICGANIDRVWRRSKYLIWDMDSGYSLFIHLGMSGRLGRFRPDYPLEAHSHVVFHLESGWQIRYRDPRRFGFLDVAYTQNLEQHPRFNKLGVEPLSVDFSPHFLKSTAQRSRRSIKTLIMDSNIVVGIGNIYANEALFRAKVRPERASNRLTDSEITEIVSAIKDILGEAIQRGGTTLRDYRNAQGEPGFFQQDLAVYAKSGVPCKICKQAIKQIRLSGRSTFYCETCQL